MIPKKEEFTKDAGTYSIVPMMDKLITDIDTPVSLFLKAEGHFLLESVETGKNIGRYSIITIGEKVRILIDDNTLFITERDEDRVYEKKIEDVSNPLEFLREYSAGISCAEYEGLPPFYGGFLGFLGYENIKYFEKVPVHSNETGIPEGILVIPEMLLVYDSIFRSVSIVYLASPGKDSKMEWDKGKRKIAEMRKRLSSKARDFTPLRFAGKTAEFRSDTSESEFMSSVEKCIEYIHSGDIIQTVLSREFSGELKEEPFNIYRKLRIKNPSPYLFYLDFGEFKLIGSSPEVMVKMENRNVLLKPIAGTRRRGETVSEDSMLTRELIENEKEKAEHLMLIDLGRNDLGKVAVPGSVKVTEMMQIEKFSSVMHIVSSLEAELDERYDLFDLIRAVFPAGTVTGAPKIRAMEIITEMEKKARGPYAGMVFYAGFNGNIDSCITIRTIVIQGSRVSFQAGAGIVADSVPEHENKEIKNKVRALVEALS